MIKSVSDRHMKPLVCKSRLIKNKFNYKKKLYKEFVKIVEVFNISELLYTSK